MSKMLNNLLRRFSGLIFSGLLFFFVSSSFTAQAQGNLLINPKRIVFDGQKRTQEINLANIGNDTARYVVSFLQIRMKEDGSFEQITQRDPGQNFADEHLRIFPRTVVLGPKEAQVIKIQTRQSDKMPPGEYRSHLYFRAVPKENPLGEKLAGTDSTRVSVRLTPVFGISIPIIIRSGKSTAKVELSNLQLEILTDSSIILNARFKRSGNMSVYGDLKVEHISLKGEKNNVGIVRGISVYTPNAARDVKIKLDNKNGINYRSGKLSVIYATPAEEKSEKLASAELLLN